MARARAVKSLSTPPPIYKCIKCGQEYNQQLTHFYKSQSPRYKHNNQYLDVCKFCVDLEYEDLIIAFHSDEMAALKYICQSYDWYYNESIATHVMSRKLVNQPLLSAYLQNRGRYKKYSSKTSYLNTLEEDLENGAYSDITLEDGESSGEIRVTKKMKEHWGAKTAPEDMAILEDHYQMLHNYNPECTGNQEIYIKDLCYAHLMKMNAMKNNNFDLATKAMSTYQSTFKNSGLEMVSESDGSENETYGVTLSLISQMTPEEYYQDKTLFRDYTGIGEYCERFIERPIRNLITGDTARDPEYHVPGDMPGDSDEE